MSSCTQIGFAPFSLVLPRSQQWPISVAVFLPGPAYRARLFTKAVPYAAVPVYVRRAARHTAKTYCAFATSSVHAPRRPTNIVGALLGHTTADVDRAVKSCPLRTAVDQQHRQAASLTNQSYKGVSCAWEGLPSRLRRSSRASLRLWLAGLAVLGVLMRTSCTG